MFHNSQSHYSNSVFGRRVIIISEQVPGGFFIGVITRSRRVSCVSPCTGFGKRGKLVGFQVDVGSDLQTASFSTMQEDAGYAMQWNNNCIN